MAVLYHDCVCGIFGVLSRKQSIEEIELSCEKMANVMNHRGPDDSTRFIKPGICIGSNRLSIVGGASGKQPFSNKTNDVVIFGNAEIYNFESLRNCLTNFDFETQCDLEVLVPLYELYGTSLFNFLNGMFAIAIGRA